MADGDRLQRLSQNLSKSIAEFGDFMSTGVKLRSQMLANRIKAKENIFYKMMEREEQNKAIMDLYKQIGERDVQFGDVNSPQLGVSSEGTLEIKTPTPGQQDWSIQFNKYLIKNKINKYRETGDVRFKPTSSEINFLKKYQGWDRYYGKEKTGEEEEWGLGGGNEGNTDNFLDTDINGIDFNRAAIYRRTHPEEYPNINTQGKSSPIIALPAHIKTTSEALAYLKEVHPDRSEDELINLLRSA